MIYDLYSRDLSRKVRSAKKTLAEKGVYINPVAPCGYRRAPNDKHLLVPDPATVAVVRYIFTLIAVGYTTEMVVHLLNAEGVLTPSKVKAGTLSAHNNWQDNHWRPQTVYTIIRDRQYIGSNVFGKRVWKEIGVRRQPTAPLGTGSLRRTVMRPLCPKSCFREHRKPLAGAYQQYTKHDKWSNPLRKKVICDVCGYAIVRRGTANRYYRCSTPRTVPDMDCFQWKIYEDDIVEMVIEAIRVCAHLAVEEKRLRTVEKEKRGMQLHTLQ
nr:recombinase family protein [uncultured Intestinimonas sp.]